MGQDRGWLLPLTGAAFVVLAIIGFAIGGEPPSPTDPVREIVEFYGDNEGAQYVGAALAALAGTLFVFFGGYVRKVLRDAGGEGGVLSSVALAGAIIFAVGLAIDSTITFTLAERADDIDPAAVQALSALYENDFIPFAMGLQIFLLATGISVVTRGGVLPKWIGWIAILLAVLAVTPLGFFAILGGAVLILVMSVMLAIRARAREPARPSP